MFLERMAGIGTMEEVALITVIVNIGSNAQKE